MANAIKWISRRAKQMKRSRPNKHKKYTSYIKDASAEYRKKNRSKKKSSPRKSAPRRAVPRKQKSVKRVRVSVSMGSLTATQHVARAKDLIAQKIANLELRKFTSRTRTEKRKIAKAIRELKRSYSKLKS